jgi:catechol 2,3-dioxygenase-like lactoylglutathione lyase family enzyme
MHVATVRYLVDDVEAGISFYTEQLGFTIVRRMGPFALLAHGDLQLWLSGPQTSAAQPMPDGRRPESGGWNRIVVEVDDLEATVAALREVGARFRNDIAASAASRSWSRTRPATRSSCFRRGEVTRYHEVMTGCSMRATCSTARWNAQCSAQLQPPWASAV